MSSHFIKENIKDKLKKVPDSPGIYFMRGKHGEILYIGKALSLRKRVRSYFKNIARLDTKTRSLVKEIVDFECILVKSEEEALILEARHIREYLPKYNIALRDDKRYPMIRVSVQEQYPRISIVRFKKDDGARYFGPFTDSGGVRKIVELLYTLFKLRRCRYVTLKKAHAKHCLYCKIDACLKPCIDAVSEDDYRAHIKNAILLLSGATKKLLHSLEHEMKKASQRREYERAAQVRDTIRALTGTIKAHARNINIYKRMASHLAQGVEELQEKLELPYSPNTIEAIDISNITGVCAVGSVVVFKQGRPYKKGYRRYQIREVEGIDDYSMIREVVRRRYAIAQDDKKDMPDFVFIDGGKGHLQAALKEARKHSINPVLFMSIAKRNEEIFVPKRKTPICLERGSSSLLLVQHVRDEAHRFALQYHRKLRRKRIKESILDDISGVGEKRKRNLLSRFGSIDALKGKTACEIAEAPSIDMNLARVIYEYIHKGVTK